MSGALRDDRHGDEGVAAFFCFRRSLNSSAASVTGKHLLGMLLILGLALWLPKMAGGSDGPVNKLYGRHLNISITDFPPFIRATAGPSGDWTYSGPLMNRIDWLSHRLHFTYNLTYEPNRAGTKINGTWTGLMGQLIRNETDLVVYPFTVSYERTKLILLTGFICADSVGLLTRYPVAQVSWKATMQPFTVEVWCGWFLSLAAVVAACVTFTYVQARIRKMTWVQGIKTIDDMLLYLLGTATAQGGFYRSRHRYLGVLALTWCVASFVFFNAYNCVLTSFLAVSYSQPEINSLQDLAQNPSYGILTVKGTASESEILTATTGPLKILGDKLRFCPSCRASGVDDFGAKMLKGRFAGVLTSISIMDLIESNYQATNQCHLTMAYQKSDAKAMYLGLPKVSPYAEEINRESLWLNAFGLHDHWMKVQRHCHLQYNRNGVQVKRQQQTLTLRHLSPAFALLLIGFGFAGVVFLYEKLRFRLIYRP